MPDFFPNLLQLDSGRFRRRDGNCASRRAPLFRARLPRQDRGEARGSPACPAWASAPHSEASGTAAQGAASDAVLAAELLLGLLGFLALLRLGRHGIPLRLGDEVVGADEGGGALLCLARLPVSTNLAFFPGRKGAVSNS